jgi:membrane protease YdiL (CAAX protease family)
LIKPDRSSIKENKVKSTKTVKEAYAFLGLTLAFSWFVFWGPLALFKIPTISFVSDDKGPAWAIALYLFGGFVPSLLAIFLTWKKEGTAGLRHLGQRIVQFNIGWRWYLAAGIVIILATVGQLVIISRLGQTFDLTLFVAQSGNLLSLLILGPISEEIGWRGYALDRLQTKWNALVSSLMVGLVWGLWHGPLFYMLGTSQHELAMPFIGSVGGVMAVSILFTWLHNNTHGSIWTAIFFHWVYIYFVQVVSSGVTRGPLYNRLEYLPYCVVALIVVMIWKPHKLMTERNGSKK